MRSALLLLSVTTATVVAIPQTGLAAAASRPALSERHYFDIPAQRLSGALLALSEQAAVRILFPYDEVSQYKARAVRGWFSTDEALAKMLSGTPLRLAFANDRTVTVSSGATRSAAMHFDRADLPAPTMPGVVAPAEPPAPQNLADGPSAEIIVTGTRTTNRTVTESLAPIDVLGKNELQTSGKQSVRDLLGTLVPSINISNGGAGASFAVKTLSLRGLSGDQLLVLVNGKRRHNTATLYINGTTQNGRSRPDPGDLDRTHRGAARRRLCAIWVGRDRRRRQHHPQARRVGQRLRPVRRQWRRRRRNRAHPVRSAPLLEHWRHRQTGPMEWEKVDRGPWSAPSEMSRMWKRAVEDACLPVTTIPYGLRHSSIVRGLRAGLPIRLVAALHDTSVGMIERHYSRWITEGLDELAARAVVPIVSLAA